MTDMHTHILPALDDGAKSASESILMLSDAYSQGVRVCVATPHLFLHHEDSIDTFLERREKSFALLSVAMEESSLPLPEILLGAEIYFDHDIHKKSNLDKLCIGETPYLLLEFPMGTYSPYWSEWLHSLILQGFSPIIAHVERYACAEKLLTDFAGMPVTYQLNGSLPTSLRGRKFLKKLLSKGVPCLFGSDMHNTTTRSCTLQKAFTKVNKRFPHEADLLFDNLASAIITTRRCI